MSWQRETRTTGRIRAHVSSKSKVRAAAWLYTATFQRPVEIFFFPFDQLRPNLLIFTN